MITIIADPQRYGSGYSDALHAASVGDYVRIRIYIRRALNEGQPLTVHVTDRLVLYWLADLADYEGIHWEVVAPEADYRRLFGSDPEPPFTPELLIALGIDSLNAPPEGRKVDPIAWVLGERIDRLWGNVNGSLPHLVQLVTWACLHADRVPTTVHPLMQRQLDTWTQNHPAYSALHPGSLTGDAINLVRRSTLARYDQEWLVEQGLLNLPVIADTFDASIGIWALNGMTPTIERYWRERFAVTEPSPELVQLAVSCMSGLSASELHSIARLLRRHADLLSATVLRDLRRRFSSIPEASAVLDELDALLPPEVPPIPDMAWSDERWLRWATESYLPYFAWTIRAVRSRDHQQVCAAAYEMWLAHRYPEWLNTTDSPLITRQFSQMRHILSTEPNAVVVWLVIDGLTWWQGRMVSEICRHQGMYPQQHEPAVSLLPSLTSISKRGLVTGIPVTELPRDSIAHTARDKLERIGLRGVVAYDEKDIIAALGSPTPPQCIIWFANMLDRLAHERQTFSDDEMVRGYLDQLGRNLGRMRAISASRGLLFHALIGSDHGSTLLPSDALTRRLPTATREVVDVWDDTAEQRGTNAVSVRAAVVTDGQRPQFDHPSDWHELDHLRYHLPQDYLIPRGYAAIGRRPTGWTHGGLTPEETIVPLLHLTPEPLKVEALNFSIRGQLRAREGGTLTVVIVNPNAAPLDGVVFQIADIAPVQIDRVGAEERVEAIVHVPPRPIEGADWPVKWALAGTVLGVEHHQEGDTRIPVRRLQREDTFSDLFG